MAKSPSKKIDPHSERVLYLSEYWTAAKPPSERVSLHSVGFLSNLGEYWTTAKPPSERVALHSVGFLLNLGKYWTAAKPPSGRIAHHSVGFHKLRRVLDCS